jgi:hypothetical protein
MRKTNLEAARALTLEAYQTVGRLKSVVRDLLPPEARS